jgi:hypothetical protein
MFLVLVAEIRTFTILLSRYYYININIRYHCLVSLSSLIRTSCCKLFNVIPNMNNIITPNNYTNAIKFTFDRYPSSGVTIKRDARP